MFKKLTFMDRVRNAVKAFRGSPIGSITYGVDVKRCSECEYMNCDEVIQMVYRDLVNYHHNGMDIDFDEVIGYLGAALD